MIETINPPTSKKPSLTRLDDSYPLIASARNIITSANIRVGVPYVNRDGESDRMNTEELSEADASFALTVGETQRVTDPSVIVDALDDIPNDELKRRLRSVVTAVLLQLNWPISKISKSVGISRQALTPRIHEHLMDEITEPEIRFLANMQRTNECLFVDYGTDFQKEKRTGLKWHRSYFLPDDDTLAIMKALWRVAWRSRGERSTPAINNCSIALDYFISLCLNRGVAAYDLARLLDVQHAAIAQRMKRFDPMRDYCHAIQLKGGMAPLRVGLPLMDSEAAFNLDISGAYFVRVVHSTSGPIFHALGNESPEAFSVRLPGKKDKKAILWNADKLLTVATSPHSWRSDSVLPVDQVRSLMQTPTRESDSFAWIPAPSKYGFVLMSDKKLVNWYLETTAECLNKASISSRAGFWKDFAVYAYPNASFVVSVNALADASPLLRDCLNNPKKIITTWAPPTGRSK